MLRNQKNTEYKKAIEQMLKNLHPYEQWMNIIKMRADGQAQMVKQGIAKMDDYNYWANGHLEEYMLKYENNEETSFYPDGVELRIKVFSEIIQELEKVIKKAAELKLNITTEMHNDYCAARGSLLGIQMAKIEIEKLGKLDKKSTSTKTDYEKKFDEEVGVVLLNTSYAKHFKFIKKLHDGNKSGRFQNKEETRAEIVKFYSKYSSEEVAGAQGTIMTIGQEIGAWINAVENENKIKFKGTESFEQYNTLAQFIYETLTVELLSRARRGESWNKQKISTDLDDYKYISDWDNFYYTYLSRYEGFFVYALIFIIIIFWIVLFALFIFY